MLLPPRLPRRRILTATLCAACLIAALFASHRLFTALRPAAPPTRPLMLKDGATLERFILDTGDVQGLSDLNRAPNGDFWSVTERDSALVPMRLLSAPRGIVDAPIALPPLGHGVECEALAILHDGTFVLGTEQQRDQRPSDDLIFVKLQGAGVAIVDRLTVPYSLWGITARRNNGIEGLCAAGDTLIAASETVIERDGARFAPLVVVQPTTRALIPHRLRLTSKVGKISALSCRQGAGGALEVMAIERHFGVTRILRFDVPAGGAMQDITPDVAYDIAAVLDDVPNMEGLVWLPDGRLLMISDNAYGPVVSATWLMVLQPAP